MMKQPGECENIDEVRQAIDQLDQKIIRLLGERFSYVKEVIRFKEPDEKSVIARDRFNAVLNSRRKLAVEAGLDPDIIEKIYRDLLNYFIQEELRLIKKK